jgi:hypothetical protein
MNATWKTALVEKLNGITALRAIVGNNIYPAYLASIRNPVFPCINFGIEGGTRRISYLPYSDSSVRFWAYSETGFEQANEIMSYITSNINNWVLTSLEVTMVFQLMADPAEIESDDLKAVSVSFLVKRI